MSYAVYTYESMGTNRILDDVYKKVLRDHILLTPKEQEMVTGQIRRNSLAIDDFVYRLDLIINREGHKRHERFVSGLRDRLYLLMEENDTFRKVWWRHLLLAEIVDVRASGNVLDQAL